MSSTQKQKEGGWTGFFIFLFIAVMVIRGGGGDQPQPKTALANEFVATMPIKKIKKPTQTYNRVILIKGHGGNDSGACSNSKCEKEQTNEIVEKTAAKLQQNGVKVVVAPEEMVIGLDGVEGLYTKTNWLKSQNLGESDLVIEVHRDSASNLTFEDASHRCGVFYQEKSLEAKQVATYIRDRLVDYGCNSTSWTSPGSRLHIIRESPIPANSFLIELGFVQGENSSEHLQLMSERLANTILNTLQK